MDTSLLNEMIEQGYIDVKKHPEANLFIYNYSQKAQYDRIWNEATMSCRGLILDSDGKVIAKPFQKFFNLGEYEGQRIPNEPFEVYDKMDGSLGISYLCNDKWQIATRGSFISDQAVKATEMLYEKYAPCLANMQPDITYLFEIIYPENRIVLDYGKEEKLVLLAMIDTASGKDLPLVDLGFPIVQRYDGLNDIEQLKKIQIDQREGFVLKYPDGYRLKIKFEEYVRLHRIITQVSTLSIWEYLKTGQSLNEIIEHVPDEFYDWVKATKNDLEAQFTAIETQCKADYKELDSRKETAFYFMTCTYPNVLFAMLDKKEYASIIWKMLKPIHAKPFFKQEEN
jgi:T4 RnlA family RNA ligase